MAEAQARGRRYYADGWAGDRPVPQEEKAWASPRIRVRSLPCNKIRPICDRRAVDIVVGVRRANVL